MRRTAVPTHALLVVQHDLRDGLELFTASLLEDELSSVERWSDPTVVDLSDLSLMDASGLRALPGPRRRAIEKRLQFAIIRCRTMVKRVFELTSVAVLAEAAPEPLEAYTGG